MYTKLYILSVDPKMNVSNNKNCLFILNMNKKIFRLA